MELHLRSSPVIYLFIGLICGSIFSFVVDPFFFPQSAVFSPHAESEIISLIDSARSTLDIEMYVFTSQAVRDALKRANDRGVLVRIIIERRVESSNQFTIFNELQSYGIAARWASSEYTLTHAKFVIVDGKRLLVGSHNFSNNALRDNREASVILSSSSLIADFERVFEEDWIKAT